jgi:YidC/Oxa1 family membrane protein insertase
VEEKGGGEEQGVQAPKEALAAPAEEQVKLVGEGFEAVVSNRGGTVVSWKLSSYLDEKGQPQELLPPDKPALVLDPPGPWNEALYQVVRQEDGVVLRWGDGEGHWVEKELKRSGPFGLRVEVRAVGLGREVGVVVARGLATWPGDGKVAALGRADLVARVGEKLKRVAVGKDEVLSLKGPVPFAGVEDQYFLLVLLPEGPTEGVLQGAQGKVVVTGQGAISGVLLGAPKVHDFLKSFGRGLEETLSFGLFGFFSLLFLRVLRWIYSWSGNWGVGIIVLTGLIRVALFPLTHKSTVAMKRMAKLQPKIKAIQDRYQERAKKDPAVRARMNQEIMELYRREGVNPMGGCLPMLVQIPILWALYTLFAFAIELRHQPFILWIKDLSAKDPTYITPILMTASMVLQQKLAPQTGDPAQRRMFMLMPFIFGLMFMNFPSGLVLYWLVNNLLTIGQQLLTERLLRGDAGKA